MSDLSGLDLSTRISCHGWNLPRFHSCHTCSSFMAHVLQWCACPAYTLKPRRQGSENDAGCEQFLVQPLERRGDRMLHKWCSELLTHSPHSSTSKTMFRIPTTRCEAPTHCFVYICVCLRSAQRHECRCSRVSAVMRCSTSNARCETRQ